MMAWRAAITESIHLKQMAYLGTWSKDNANKGEPRFISSDDNGSCLIFDLKHYPSIQSHFLNHYLTSYYPKNHYLISHSLNSNCLSLSIKAS